MVENNTMPKKWLVLFKLQRRSSNKKKKNREWFAWIGLENSSLFDQTITRASCLDIFHSCIPRVFCKSSPLSQWACPGMPPLAGHTPLGSWSQKNISGWGFLKCLHEELYSVKRELTQLISPNYILEPSLAFWTSQSLRNIHLIR